MSAYDDLIRDVQKGIRDGSFRPADFESVIGPGGHIPEEPGLLVMDFLMMGRDAIGARRGLAEAIWKRDRERPTMKISAVLPAGTLASETGEVQADWYPYQLGGECDVCGAPFAEGKGFGSIVPGPTFESVGFDESVFSCGQHPDVVVLRADRNMALTEHGVFRKIGEKP